MLPAAIVAIKHTLVLYAGKCVLICPHIQRLSAGLPTTAIEQSISLRYLWVNFYSVQVWGGGYQCDINPLSNMAKAKVFSIQLPSTDQNDNRKNERCPTYKPPSHWLVPTYLPTYLAASDFKYYWFEKRIPIRVCSSASVTRLLHCMFYVGPFTSFAQ